MKDQLDDAAVGTTKAFNQIRNFRGSSEDGEGAAGAGGGHASPGAAAAGDEAQLDKSKTKERKMAPEVALMQPILRFLQLLCENHNHDLQVVDGVETSGRNFLRTFKGGV
jgi:inositol 1,4,5-triphosphate receptor type 1